jgi:hypothetical protein
MSMQPTLRKPLASLAAALVAVSLLPGAALADGERVVTDPKFDNVALSRNGRLDIVEASAVRRGTEIKHAVKMRAKLKAGRSKERPGILINTKGGSRGAYEYIVFGSTIFKVPRTGQPKAIGSSVLRSSKRTWTFSFDAAEIPNLPGSYGWAAITQKGNGIADVAPDKGYVNSPR